MYIGIIIANIVYGSPLGVITAAKIEMPRMAQRRHDACTTLLRMLLSSGTLGEHNGVPLAVVATCTVTDLEHAEERRPWQSRSSTNSP